MEVSTRKGIDAGGMPFPPGVGGRGELSSVQDYDVITTDKAIDEKNVGSRMLRSMGWQEGLVCSLSLLLSRFILVITYLFVSFVTISKISACKRLVLPWELKRLGKNGLSLET